MAYSPVIKFPDGSSVEVVDPDNITPTYSDLVTEVREVDGVVYISFASFINDGDGDTGKKARVVSRLRMSRPRAETIYAILGNMFSEQQGTKDHMN